jgi:hypothetical protein
MEYLVNVLDLADGTDQHGSADASDSYQIRASSQIWIGVTSDSGKLSL